MPSKLVFLCCLVSVVLADNPEELLFRRTMEQCLNSDSTYTCLANKAAKAVERALDWDVPIFEGITLARNEEKLDNYTTPRSYDGISRLTSVLSKFLESHKLVVDLTPEDEDVGTARKEEGGLGFGGGDKKGKKKEKKYASYAMMVMMGIFGLTGPLVLKALALIAGKALIASKMALLIVGSVALKKLFEKESHTPSVKVRTVQEEHHHDDHDRLLYNYNMNNYNSNAYSSNNTPYNYAKMSR